MAPEQGRDLIGTGERSPTPSTTPRTSSVWSRSGRGPGAIARHLAGFMRQTDRFAKTIVFCVDQEHALEMRSAIAEPQPRCGPRSTRLCVPGHGGRGTHRQRSPGQVPGRGDACARHPDHLPTADYRRRRSDVQERRVGPGRRFDARVQADHRTRHATANRLRQACVQTSSTTRAPLPRSSRIPTSTASRCTNSKTSLTGRGRRSRCRGSGSRSPIPISRSRALTSPCRRAGLDHDDESLPRKYYVDDGEVEIVKHLVDELDSEGRKLACRAARGGIARRGRPEPDTGPEEARGYNGAGTVARESTLVRPPAGKGASIAQGPRRNLRRIGRAHPGHAA